MRQGEVVQRAIRYFNVQKIVCEGTLGKAKLLKCFGMPLCALHLGNFGSPQSHRKITNPVSSYPSFCTREGSLAFGP